VNPLFTPPNFPSYPSNHAAFSWGRAEMPTYLFRHHAEEANAMGLGAAQSRVWAGIHYQLDLDAGKALGRTVAQKYIEWAENDGSK
jgi:membrane-associated phospholipid phosphatase